MCESEVGQGTKFRVFLPAQTDAPVTEAASAEPAASPRGDGQLVLMVDDDSSVLTITKDTLEAFGYRVLTAEDGAHAMGLFALNQRDVNVVVLDMVMPVMDGPALIAALRRINPQVRIVATSGIGANEAKATAAGVRHFLGKPYAASLLLQTVHAAITAPA